MPHIDKIIAEQQAANQEVQAAKINNRDTNEEIVKTIAPANLNEAQAIKMEQRESESVSPTSAGQEVTSPKAPSEREKIITSSEKATEGRVEGGAGADVVKAVLEDGRSRVEKVIDETNDKARSMRVNARFCEQN